MRYHDPADRTQSVSRPLRKPRPAVEPPTNAELLKALERLAKISGEAHIELVNSHAVRKLGEFMAARDEANDLIRRAKLKA